MIGRWYLKRLAATFHNHNWAEGGLHPNHGAWWYGGAGRVTRVGYTPTERRDDEDDELLAETLPTHEATPTFDVLDAAASCNLTTERNNRSAISELDDVLDHQESKYDECGICKIEKTLHQHHSLNIGLDHW